MNFHVPVSHPAHWPIFVIVHQRERELAIHGTTHPMRIVIHPKDFHSILKLDSPTLGMILHYRNGIYQLFGHDIYIDPDITIPVVRCGAEDHHPADTPPEAAPPPPPRPIRRDRAEW